METSKQMTQLKCHENFDRLHCGTWKKKKKNNTQDVNKIITLETNKKY